MDLRFAICGLRLSCLRFMPAACGSLLFLLVLCGGCEAPQGGKSAVSQAPGDKRGIAEQPLGVVPSGFGPAKVSILPLSEITGSNSVGQGARLNVYVALLDAFGCPIKAPCILRFEVYEYVRRSAQAKGSRLMIWPDIDLTHPAENHQRWRDFLRAYEFQFDLSTERDKTYILEATCLNPDGRRLTADCAVRVGQ